MSQAFNYPIYRKVKDKKIYIKIESNKKMIAVGLDFGRKGRCYLNYNKCPSGISLPIRKNLFNGEGDHISCSEQEFLIALKYALDSPELIKEPLV